MPERDAHKRATIDDVASIAGSVDSQRLRALSGSRAVRAETLKRVTEAANSLDYRINPAASALRSKVTRTVGMVVPDIDNPFFPAVVKAVEGALYGSGMSLFLCDANDSSDVEAERLEALLSRGVDGVLISPVDGQRSRPAVAAAVKRVPLVQLDRRVQVESDVVSVDHGRGIELVVEHLINEGRTTFAFVTTAKRLSVAVERLEAYVQGVRVVDKASATRVLAGDLSIGWGRGAGPPGGHLLPRSRDLRQRPHCSGAVAGLPTARHPRTRRCCAHGLRRFDTRRHRWEWPHQRQATPRDARSRGRPSADVLHRVPHGAAT